jgi:hypothetical protein
MKKTKVNENMKNKIKFVVGVMTLLFAFGTVAYGSTYPTPYFVGFGSQTVGSTSAPYTVTVTNGNTYGITISSVSDSTAQFSYSGPTLPVYLNPGQSLTGSVTFKPFAAKFYSDNLKFTQSNGSTISVGMNGTGSLPSTCISSSGYWANHSLSKTATGSFRVTFDAMPSASAINGTIGLSLGSASSYTNLAALVRFNDTGTIDAMNSTAFTAAAKIPYFAGTNYHFILDVNAAAHTYNAYVMIGSVQTTIGSNYKFRFEQATTSSLNDLGAVDTIGTISVCNAALSLQTASATAPAITTQPVSKTVIAGNTASFTVAATGTAPLTFQWKKNGIAISGAISSAYTTPAETTTDNNAQFTVAVSNSAGSVISNPAVLTVTNATSAPTITTQPVSKTVIAGNTASFTVAATGTAPLTFQWKKNGIAISGAISSAYTTPAETMTDNNAQFAVAVSNSAGSATSNAATLTVNAATYLLNSSSSSLSFGNVNVASNSTRAVTLTNSGNSPVTISNVTVSGAGFNATGVSSGLIMAPGQMASLTATFAPSGAGSTTGSVQVVSNATNSPDSIALSGTGVTVVNHSVGLSWSPGTSTVMGYNTYSSAQSGGPYTKLTTAPVAVTSYTDSSVQSGKTYYFVVTAVDSGNLESGYSSEVSASVP